MNEPDGRAPRVLAGEIRIPYRWTAGEVMGGFLAELRETGRILGARCPGCRKTWAPPPDGCPACHADFGPSDLREVGPEGTVTSYTRVRTRLWAEPTSPPYALVAVRLDGADTDLVHLVRDRSLLERLAVGMRLRARPRAPEARTGEVLDIDGFVEVSS